jgi:hypothetical protein
MVDKKLGFHQKSQRRLSSQEMPASFRSAGDQPLLSLNLGLDGRIIRCSARGAEDFKQEKMKSIYERVIDGEGQNYRLCS